MKRAVLVGINYTGSASPLNGCINDIINIKNLLTSSCGFCEENIRVLTDNTVDKPIRQNIERELRWLVENSVENDTLVLYYSGHGAQIKDTDGDETDTLDEVLVPLDYVTRGVIKDDWVFSEVVNKVKRNTNLWMFTDCCHSGTIVDLKYTYSCLSELKRGEIRNDLEYKSDDWTTKFGITLQKKPDIVGNVYLFSGCQDREKSTDAYLNDMSQGAFTNCFLETISRFIVTMPDKTKRYNNSLKLFDIIKEVNCRLDIKGFRNQNPQLSVSKQSDLEKLFIL